MEKGSARGVQQPCDRQASHPGKSTKNIKYPWQVYDKKTAITDSSCALYRLPLVQTAC